MKCFYGICLAFLLLMLSFLYQPTYQAQNIDQDEARMFAKKHKLRHGTVVYDYPDNPYVYWRGKKVYLEK